MFCVITFLLRRKWGKIYRFSGQNQDMGNSGGSDAGKGDRGEDSGNKGHEESGKRIKEKTSPNFQKYVYLRRQNNRNEIWKKQ